MRLHTCYKLARGEGFGDIVICAQPHASYLIDIFLTGRYHNNGNILHRTDTLADLEAIRSWKHEIEYDQIPFFIQCQFQTGSPVMLDLNLKIGEFQVVTLQICDRDFVFND